MELNAVCEPHLRVNMDQIGFNYELVSSRTLTYRGEKTVFGYAQSPTNKVTHSYTVQYFINAAGGVVGKVCLCLQEPTGRLGPQSQASLHVPDNVLLT